MSEAEGVLLDWAWRGIERLIPPAAGVVVAAGAADLSELRKELDVFLAAVFDRRFEIVPREPTRRSLWSLPWRRAPWTRELDPLPATDGCSIYLPRALAGEGDAAASARLRLMALLLAARIERGSVAELPSDPLARDLYWSLDGVRACAWLCAELPGLRVDFRAACELELAHRRTWTRPTSLEEWAEQWVRGLLRGDAPTGPERPRELAGWADAQARHLRAERGDAYRGIAPVRHLGKVIEVPCDVLRGIEGGAQRRPGGLPARNLRVVAESLPPEPESTREAPWLVPGGDPLLSAEPTSRIAHPLDRESALDLETLAGELDRFDAIPRVRSEHTVHEVLESEAVRPSTGRAASGTSQMGDVLLYPEWDYRAARYRPDHCHVREGLGSEGDPSWAGRVLGERADVVRALRSQTEALRPRLEQQPRQLQGDEIDLDAYVEHRSERLRSRSAAERVYRSERRLRRDFAVALVLDASASTERTLAIGTRVLDLEKEAALLFCVATRWLGDRCAVYAFASRGSKAVRVQQLKGFHEPHGTCVERRIAALDAADCTRLGAALRHVQQRLCEQSARARLLLILSDGRPSDDDGYDGRYGSEDTRRAVQEAVQRGLVPFCLSIQPDPDAHLDRVFGPARYVRLLTPSALPERLTAAYRELTRRS